MRRCQVKQPLFLFLRKSVFFFSNIHEHSEETSRASQTTVAAQSTTPALGGLPPGLRANLEDSGDTAHLVIGLPWEGGNSTTLVNQQKACDWCDARLMAGKY